MSDTEVRNSLRGITRDAVRARIAAIAVARFERDGFDNVTVEQIAAEVGMSARSFHRYFPAKEDAVIGDPERYRRGLAEALSERPADEPVWDALREAFIGMVARGDEDNEHGRRSVRVMMSAPSLRARNLEKHLAFSDTLIPVIIDRLRASGTPGTSDASDASDLELRAATIAHAALSCFDVAISHWSVSHEDAPSLLRRTFDTLRTAE